MHIMHFSACLKFCGTQIKQSTFFIPLIKAVYIQLTVRAEILAVVLFSRISRVKPSRKFPLQFMSIYSNDNISKISKLTTRELPHLAQTAKITVRENNGVYSSRITRMSNVDGYPHYSNPVLQHGYFD